MGKLLWTLLLVIASCLPPPAQGNSDRLEIVNSIRQMLGKLSGIEFPVLIEDAALAQEAEPLVRRDCHAIRPSANRRFFLNSFWHDGSAELLYPNTFDYGVFLYSGLTADEARIPYKYRNVSELARAYIEKHANDPGFMMGTVEQFNPAQVAVGCFDMRVFCNGTAPIEFGLGPNVHYQYSELCLMSDSSKFDNVKEITRLIPKALEEVRKARG